MKNVTKFMEAFKEIGAEHGSLSFFDIEQEEKINKEI